MSAIYLIKCDKFYKIGYATDPVGRFSSIKTSNPLKVELVFHHSLPSNTDAREVESFIHGVFADKRSRGEWFELSERDLVEFGVRMALIYQYFYKEVGDPTPEKLDQERVLIAELDKEFNV